MIRSAYVGLVALALNLSAAVPGRADFIQVGFTGEVTGVSDPLGIFNNTFGVGSPVTGSYAYTPSGMFALPPTSTAATYLSTAGSRNLLVRLGGVTLQTFPSPFLRLRVTDGDPSIGDQYAVGSSTQFPSAFGFPADPDISLTYPDVELTLTDPAGSALSSLALPLSAPNSAAFATRIGSVIIRNADTDDVLAEARFSIRTIAAVPEPGSMVLLGTGAIGMLGYSLRRRADKASATRA